MLINERYLSGLHDLFTKRGDFSLPIKQLEMGNYHPAILPTSFLENREICLLAKSILTRLVTVVAVIQIHTNSFLLKRNKA